MNLKFYKCNVCGNIVCKVEDSGMSMTCCGKQMVELKPGSTDGAVEKHVPIYEIIDNRVFIQVGKEEHPMEDYHYIEFIGIETNRGFHIKYLKPGESPKGAFRLGDSEKLISVFEYCNLHGMFKNDAE